MGALGVFFERVRDDHRIGPIHVSIYAALVGMQEERSTGGYFPVTRKDVMERAKILGKTTYYKCLRELAEFGYLDYRPEHHPGRRSGVRL